MDELSLRRNAHALAAAADELEGHVRKLRQLAGDDRIPVELTEDELAFVVGMLDPTPGVVVPTVGPPAEFQRAIWAKLDRALVGSSGGAA